MDEKKLKEEYPFLDNILKAYSDYDNPVDTGDELYQFYNNKIIYPQKKENYTDISVKLLRNLVRLSDNTYKGSQNFEYCIYLYHWIYYRTKEYDIPELLLSIIFDEFEAKKLNGRINICPYDIYKIISKESDEIIKLYIFNRNIHTINDILMNKEQSKNCRFQKFIHSCVNIYKRMNKRYCLNESEKRTTNKNICDIVSEFSMGYTSFILSQKNEKEIDLPLLSSPDGDDNTGTTNIVGCSSYGNQEETKSINDDQSGSSTLHTVPKILGTMAGVSSFIAMSYKFTPFRKFFQLRRGAASLSNSLNEKEPINLINNESDILNGSSNNTKYNIGYGSV